MHGAARKENPLKNKQDFKGSLRNVPRDLEQIPRPLKKQLCLKIPADQDIFVKYQRLYLSFRISICAEVKADCSFAIHGKGFGGEKPMESGFIHHHSL